METPTHFTATKSWQWIATGAGYGDRQHRSVRCLGGSVRTENHGARGVLGHHRHWSRMCLSWPAGIPKKGVFPAGTCFEHRIGDGEHLYQRREAGWDLVCLPAMTRCRMADARPKKLVSADSGLRPSRRNGPPRWRRSPLGGIPPDEPDD
ncbi:DUF995 domain-containing protein [Brucella abortus]|nr:DUF995 domain-containing protein [Brucella abortus]